MQLLPFKTTGLNQLMAPTKRRPLLYKFSGAESFLRT